MSSSSSSLGSSPSPGRLVFEEPAPGVARLTISNPAKRGALDHPILDAFTHRLRKLDARCLIITGEGGMTVRVRLYAVERRLFQLIALGPNVATAPSATSFLESFRLAKQN